MAENLLSNTHEYTVSELAGAVKRSIEDEFGFVRVRGELGRVTRAASGHVYLDLKDDRSVLSSVIWKGSASRIRFAPEQGMEVVATGRMTTFPGQSRYQLVIENLEPAGAGALMALFEERKKKLDAEGLFAEERKKPLPYLPEIIGVVTSPSGAVIRDILHRLRERFPRRVLVWPTLVQGKGAEDHIAAAIRGFNNLPTEGELRRPDVLIVARGGGSLEDLWCFNEEIVVRAAAESRIPLISAVGHETDTTLIDYASDRRAPTPTAAAEFAVPVRADLLRDTLDAERRLIGAMARSFETRRGALLSASRGLGRPEDLTGVIAQRFDRASAMLRAGLRARLDEAATRAGRASARFGPRLISAGLNERRSRTERQADRLVGAMRRIADRDMRRVEGARLAAVSLTKAAADARRDLSQRWNRLRVASSRALTGERAAFESASKLLETLSYESILKRGFALVRSPEGAVLRRSADIERGAAVLIRFADGERRASMLDEQRPDSVKKTPRRRPGGAQKSLFDD